ncbi:uncharacterized protein LOC130777167 [Actinidia eriantha]|uniref:uncharacterized protein LOC130777167 n=1 Tax=Actinidia eriantha TaxID=165200 RepID=UPI00258EF465|nr:uncharacterized protein LOC130777167 [Actinidia eriantha]
MDARYKEVTGQSCQQRDHITIDHHYRIDIFNVVIDFQLEKLNNRFSEGAMKLLILSSALEPNDGFKSLDIDKICTLVESFYPCDFTNQKMPYLKYQLEHYKLDVPQHEKFQNMSTISELCQVLVEINKSQHYYLIDRLIRLVLTLPITAATTERAFSAMKRVQISDSAPDVRICIRRCFRWSEGYIHPPISSYMSAEFLGYSFFSG